MPEEKNGVFCGELLYLHALTSLHPGSGTALGVVDLPVQRERHTQWPTIPGSAIKGVLRDYCRRAVGPDAKSADSDSKITSVFGPPMGKAEEHAGAVSFTDARILAFPVRSLRGVFVWITCPGVLERYQRDLAMLGKPAGNGGIPKPQSGQAMAVEQEVGVDRKAVLEEFEFEVKGDSRALAEMLADAALIDEGTKNRFRTHLVILSDDDFNYFVRNATEVAARVGLDYESKTVKEGALFYQEFLPAETLFYSAVIASASRRPKAERLGARDVLRQIRGWLTDGKQMPVIQIGGDETTGKGLCAVKISEEA
jgi:CRISPR-associated protein Cmr4